MTILTISEPTEPGFLAKFLHRLRAFDEALHHDPAEAQQRRIERLEARLEVLESNASAGPREGLCANSAALILLADPGSRMADTMPAANSHRNKQRNGEPR